MRFRRGVYLNRGRITPGCQVLLLRLSEDMSANAIVSVPRTRLAEEFGCDPARITEWMKQARAAGFLSIVKRARQHTTAVYQGLYVSPAGVREGAPLDDLSGVRSYAPGGVRESAPLGLPQGCALTPTQEEVQTAGSEPTPITRLAQRGSNERSAS